MVACSSEEKRTSSSTVIEKDRIENNLDNEKELSVRYCSGCHLYPNPSDLDRQTWEHSVLPLMGRRFGIYEENTDVEELISGAVDPVSVKRENIFPQQQQISDELWDKIVKYYLTNAPTSLPRSEADYEVKAAESVKIIAPELDFSIDGITMIKIETDPDLVYVGGVSGGAGKLVLMDHQFNLLQELPLPSPPVDIYVEQTEAIVTLIGTLWLRPSGNRHGELIRLVRSKQDLVFSGYSRFLDRLNRPVQTVIEDLTGNGRKDILVAEFGDYTGSLSLYVNEGTGSYRKYILKETSGAVRVEVHDLNGDGSKDIVALFGQGDEGISVFYHYGDVEFREERILQFNPAWGSTYFEMMDLNGDGHLDIIYCNGDNGDYPPVLKPYHGIRLFENDGQNNFQQVYFYPMDGAYRCSSIDFRGEGKNDLLAISYFPDENADKRLDLIYLKHDMDYNYEVKEIDTGSQNRWLTFDTGRLGSESRNIALLGSFGSFDSPVDPLHQGVPLILLTGDSEFIVRSPSPN